MPAVSAKERQRFFALLRRDAKRAEPQTTAAKVAEAFCAVLEAPAVRHDLSFFDQGGDSFLMVVLAIELEQIFPIAVPVSVFEETSSVIGLAAWIDARLADG